MLLTQVTKAALFCHLSNLYRRK
ncbi:hypothetical protein CBM2589_U10010 [Cupriavidus taiwanensis]|uniref:Uncharacterized protein n=1 Tax=Cupriavidus taiwanensis TaxID=164546 RepID=A0A375CQB0_9BURK|nr:hypothetical protein CBM2589_U10010 [Cupriavidus taiwanensis]